MLLQLKQPTLGVKHSTYINQQTCIFAVFIKSDSEITQTDSMHLEEI